MEATRRRAALNHVEHTRVRHMPIMVPVAEHSNEIVLVNNNNATDGGAGANQNNGAA